LIKLTIGIGKLKRKIDKKETIKTRDRIREMEREIKEFK
jgi:tmRNA-binding protein